MSNIEHTSYVQFLSLLSKATSESPILSTAAILPAQGQHLQDSSISRSQQERDRDIASSVTLPPPWITQAQLLTIYTTIQDKINITNLGATAALSTFESLGPGSIVLAALQEWAQAQIQETDLIKQIEKDHQKNPLLTTIKKYVSAHPRAPLQNLEGKYILEKHTDITSILKDIPPDLLATACQLSEHQILLGLLERWANFETQQAMEQREALRLLDIDRKRFHAELLRHLISKEEQNSLKQPFFSIVTIGCLLGVNLVEGIAQNVFSQAMEQLFDPHLVPASLCHHLAFFIQGYANAALTWATPTAMSLMKLEKNHLSNHSQALISAKSYCLSLLRLIEDQEMTSCIQADIAKYVSKGQLTKEHGYQAYAALKTSLLLKGATLLYEQEMGGVTAQEIAALVKGELHLPEGSLLHTFATFLRLEMAPLHEKQKNFFLTSFLEQLIDEKEADTSVTSTKLFLSLWDQNYSHQVAISCPG